MFKEFKYFLMLKVLPRLVYSIIVLLRLTYRVDHVNDRETRKRWKDGENFVFCFWHGRLLLMPYAKGPNIGKVLISRHRDGEFIARVVSFFGLGAIRGSYRKGSVSSLREIIQELRKGCDVAITPDGPKGPRYTVKPGILELAKLTGKAIVPITFGASKKKLFNPGTGSFSRTLFQRSIFCGATPFR